MPKITDYGALGATPAAGDQFVLVDVSDTSQSADGTTKRLDADYLVLGDGSLATVTGGGTIALGGYTLTLSADATIDLSGGSLTITAGNVTFSTAGTLDLNSQTLTLTASTGGGTLNLNGKTLAIATGNLTVTANAAGTALTVNEDGTLSLGGNTLEINDGNVTITEGTLDLNAETLTVTATTGGGTLNLGGFTLTMPKTGTVVTGTGTDGRVAAWSGDANTLAATTLAKSGAGVLTLSAAGGYTLTVPKTGTVVVGTGTTGRVAKFSDANTLTADTLAKTGAGVLTLEAASDYTATVAKTGTVAMTSDVVGSPVVFFFQTGAAVIETGHNWATEASYEIGESTTNVTYSHAHHPLYIDKSWFSGTWECKLYMAWDDSASSHEVYLRDLTNASDIISTAAPTISTTSFTGAAGANLDTYTSADIFSSLGTGGAWYGLGHEGGQLLTAYLVFTQA